MFLIEYYTEDDAQPVAAWLDSLPPRDKKKMEARIQALSEHGLLLLDTRMLKALRGNASGLYELSCDGLRIVLCYEKSRESFVLLHGFRKQRQRERDHIDTAARRFLRMPDRRR